MLMIQKEYKLNKYGYYDTLDIRKMFNYYKKGHPLRNPIEFIKCYIYLKLLFNGYKK